MPHNEDQKMTLDELLSRVDQLTPDEQEVLRNRLNDRMWNQRLQDLSNSDFTRVATDTWNRLTERLASGNIDEDIKQGSAKVWKDFLDRLEELLTAVSGNSTPDASRNRDDVKTQLESVHYDLECQLIQMRQAVAQAIATETQLQQHLSKNKDLAATWQNRAAMVAQQHNDELTDQAMQRSQQYVKAAEQLESQLHAQKDVTAGLRKRLTDMEKQVHAAKTKASVLVAREKAARATERANEILSRTNAKEAQSILERMEQKVAEREATSAAMDALAEQSGQIQNDSDDVLSKAITALERATLVIERMELLLLAREQEEKS